MPALGHENMGHTSTDIALTFLARSLLWVPLLPVKPLQRRLDMFCSNEAAWTVEFSSPSIFRSLSQSLTSPAADILRKHNNSSPQYIPNGQAGTVTGSGRNCQEQWTTSASLRRHNHGVITCQNKAIDCSSGSEQFEALASTSRLVLQIRHRGDWLYKSVGFVNIYLYDMY